MSTTIKDVAQLAGVSVSTASIALRGMERVSEVTRQRVLEAAEKLNYQPNAAARTLVTRRSGAVGLILDDIRDPYFHGIARGVESVAWEKGLTLLLVDSHRSKDKQKAAVETFRQHRVDGVIFAGSGNAHQNNFSIGHDVPVVALGRHMSSVPSVQVDNVFIGRLAAAHLAEKGRKRLAVIHGPSQLTASTDRLEGFRQGVNDAGFVLHPSFVVPGDFTPEGGRYAAERLMEQAKAQGVAFPDGIFASNDQMALGVLQALRREGMSVPRDVAVVGAGGIPFAALVSPSLTTIDLPTEEMGATAMNVLVNLMQGRAPLRDPTVLPVQLLERESTG